MAQTKLETNVDNYQISQFFCNGKRENWQKHRGKKSLEWADNLLKEIDWIINEALLFKVFSQNNTFSGGDSFRLFIGIFDCPTKTLAIDLLQESANNLENFLETRNKEAQYSHLLLSHLINIVQKFWGKKLTRFKFPKSINNYREEFNEEIMRFKTKGKSVNPIQPI